MILYINMFRPSMEKVNMESEASMAERWSEVSFADHECHETSLILATLRGNSHEMEFQEPDLVTAWLETVPSNNIHTDGFERVNWEDILPTRAENHPRNNSAFCNEYTSSSELYTRTEGTLHIRFPQLLCSDMDSTPWDYSSLNSSFSTNFQKHLYNSTFSESHDQSNRLSHRVKTVTEFQGAFSVNTLTTSSSDEVHEFNSYGDFIPTPSVAYASDNKSQPQVLLMNSNSPSTGSPEENISKPSLASRQNAAIERPRQVQVESCEVIVNDEADDAISRPKLRYGLTSHTASSLNLKAERKPFVKRKVCVRDSQPQILPSQKRVCTEELQRPETQNEAPPVMKSKVNMPTGICMEQKLTTASVEQSSALNRNGNPRAQRGSATDPQSVYARQRRERINERLKILQKLVPNGDKVDISTMLEEAISYVKFLQLQVKFLSSDEYWMYAPIAYNGTDVALLNIPFGA